MTETVRHHREAANSMKRIDNPNEDEFEDLEPTAGLSSAASCISFSVFGEKFRPVYTHQSFDGEHIRGYAPVPEAADEAAEIATFMRKELSSNNKRSPKKVKFIDDEQNTDNDGDEEKEDPLPHSSYRHQCNASHCLSIDVTLSPSCRYSAVSIHLERKGERRIKRKRKASINVSYTDDDDEIDFDDYSDSSVTSEEAEASHSAKRKRRGQKETNSNLHQNKRMHTRGNLKQNYNNADDDSISLGSDDTDCDENDSYEDEEDADDDEDFCGEYNNNSPTQGKTRRQSMELEDIMDRLSRGIPAIQCYKEFHNGIEKSSRNKTRRNEYLSDPKEKMSKEEIENDFLKSTIGVELCQYSRKTKAPKSPEGEEQFVLFFADGKDPLVVDYHKQVQKLALWYIETAEDVDLTSDEGGGFWKVLYLFQKHEKETPQKKKTTQYSFVGFVTLFFFFAPFKKPKPGLIVRICQIVILPPYQRSGHGKKMLRAVYDIAQNRYASVLGSKSQDEIVEINVEVPAPAFVALRNRLDFEILKENVTSNGNENNENLWLPRKYFTGDTFDKLLDSDAVQAAAYAKITPSQIQIAYELLKLESLQSQIKKKSSSDSTHFVEELEKKYRLMVKKRLNIANKDDLAVLHSKAEKQKELAKIFDRTLLEYQKLLPN